MCLSIFSNIVSHVGIALLHPLRVQGTRTASLSPDRRYPSGPAGQGTSPNKSSDHCLANHPSAVPESWYRAGAPGELLGNQQAPETARNHSQSVLKGSFSAKGAFGRARCCELFEFLTYLVNEPAWFDQTSGLLYCNTRVCCCFVRA